MTHNGTGPSPLNNLTRDRVRNASRDAIKSGDATYKGEVAAGGAIAYALLEVANALHRQADLRELRPELEPMWKHRLRNTRNRVLNKLTAKL